MTLIQNIINRLSQQVDDCYARSQRQAIVQSALIAVVKRHPDWADVGFDEHFVTHRGASLFDNYFQTGQLPDAAAIAKAWSNQYFWQSTTKLDAQRRFMPVAQDFVYIGLSLIWV